jgi:multidrug resistance efflux pump
VMSPVHDSIQRIDLPVTPVSAEPDPNPKNVVAVRRLPVRQAAWIGIYASLGFVVFGYTALVLYSNLFRMEVQSAVVDAPVLKVLARGDGELPFIRIKTGEKVKQGETVIYFADDDLEKQIDMARIEIESREATLDGLIQRRGGELERMTEYAAIEVKSIEQTKVAIKAMTAEVEAAGRRHSRLQSLLKRGLTTRPRVEDAEILLGTARGKLDGKRLELEEQKRLADTNPGKFFYTGRELVGEMTEIDSSITQARHQVALAHQAHEALLKHRERLSIKAPFDGSVASLPAPEHAAVKRGDVVAVFQKDDERWVTAFLTQDEVMKVGLGDTASVYFPALERSVRATVMAIDRTSGFKEEVSRRYSWRGAEDRSAEVRLEFLAGPGPEAGGGIEAGLPAVVLFEAQSTNPILAAMWRKVSSLFL